MDPVKQRVLALIGADRIRRRKHFDEQAVARGVILEEAIQAIRSGAELKQEADADARFGVRHRFRGRDDEPADVVWLHTVFPAGRRRARRV